MPLPYYTPSPFERDLSHLRTLAILHYIWGGLCVLLPSFHLFYLFMGIMMLKDPDGMFGGPASAGAASSSPPAADIRGLDVRRHGHRPDLAWLGRRGIESLFRPVHAKASARRLLSLIMAGVNCGVGFISVMSCLTGPMGVTLGVFTFVVLLRPSVRTIYTDQLTLTAEPDGSHFSTL